jgi:hypothetical protein
LRPKHKEIALFCIPAIDSFAGQPIGGVYLPYSVMLRVARDLVERQQDLRAMAAYLLKRSEFAGQQMSAGARDVYIRAFPDKWGKS